MTEIPDLFDFEFVNIIIIIIFVILPKRLRTTQKTDEDYIYIFICDFKITIVIFFSKFCKKCDLQQRRKKRHRFLKPMDFFHIR